MADWAPAASAPPEQVLVVSQEAGVSLNIGVKMNQNYSPLKPTAIQIASVTPFIGEFALGPLLSGLSLGKGAAS
jgi:hypothetical protein